MHQLIEAVPQFEGIMEKAFRYLWENPETGYKEWKAHAYLAEAFRALGYELTEAGNIPGFYCDADTGRPGPMVAVFGEMDALICRNHPEADPETGAVHCCGHACQPAALLGLAAALKVPGAMDGLCGKVRLMVVPAEELIEVEYREELRKKGIISYYGGKVEFMRRGFLDGVDAAFMLHTSTGKGAHGGGVGKGSNGCIAKTITYTGKSAHAGGAPHMGINALYAANQGISAINALRETFKDSDHIRVHPIITSGGTAVNAIPEKVTMESYVRGASMEAIQAANLKVNRALAASAAAMGANVEICDRPGYSPRIHAKGMMELTRDAMEETLEVVNYKPESWGSGCSDLGDVSMVMPAVHPYIYGATGTSHGADFVISDPYTALVDSARVQASMVVKLLENEGARAAEIKKNFEPTFPSMEAFFAFIDNLTLDQKAVTYNEDGTITLKFSN